MANEASRDLIGTTMSCRHIEDLVVVVHEDALLPSDAEWERYVGWCKILLTQYPLLKVLVLAGQQSPSSKQRSLYNSEIHGDRVRIAVLIGSRHVLAIVKVFAWFVRNIKAFDKKDVPAALEYLGVASSQPVTDALRELGGRERAGRSADVNTGR